MATQAPRFPSCGYMVVSLDLDPAVIQAALAQAMQVKHSPVFLEVDGADDPKPSAIAR